MASPEAPAQPPLADGPQPSGPEYRLLDSLWEHRTEFLDLMVDRIRSQQEFFLTVPVEALRQDVRLTLEWTLQFCRTPTDSLSDSEVAVLDQVGKSQSLLGVPVEEMLHAWHTGVDVFVEVFSDRAGQFGVSSDGILEFLRTVIHASNIGMTVGARAHRRTDLALDRGATDRRTSFIRAALLGTDDGNQLRSRAEEYGLDTETRYVAIRAQPGRDQLWQDLEAALGLAQAVHAGTGMSALIDGELVGFMASPVRAASPGRAGVGTWNVVDNLARSFQRASRVLRTLRRLEIDGTYDLAGVGLRAAVLEDADMGEALHDRYLANLLDSEFGSEVIATVRVYVLSGQHVDTTARSLHVHPNTVR
ncbi:MAG TPA: helix-turn-helix domain-containing protein, partial [Mycobacterium sp.]